MADIAATIRTALGDLRGQSATVERPAQLLDTLLPLLRKHFAGHAQLQAAEQLLSFLFDGSQLGRPELNLSGSDAAFVGNMLQLKPTIVSSGRLRQRVVPIRVTGNDDDCLADGVGHSTLFGFLNLALLSALPSRNRTAIVTSVRDEGMSVVEWLAHHRSAGFDHFFVYTNDNTDGSLELLHDLANYGVINLIENHVSNDIAIQAKVLEHSLHLLPELRDFEWALYIDADEFFIARCEPALSMSNFFELLGTAFPEQQPSAVCVNWKWFGSENAFEPTEGLLLERFVHSIHNEHVKSLVRLRDVVSMRRVHVPVLVDNAWLVDSTFKRVEPTILMKPRYGHAQLNHYWNKSFQEFVLKRARGRISKGLSGEPLEFSNFFDWGNNMRRGNLDEPDERLLRRVRQEYQMLLNVPGVSAQLTLIRNRVSERLKDLDESMGLTEIYRKRGHAG